MAQHNHHSLPLIGLRMRTAHCKAGMAETHFLTLKENDAWVDPKKMIVNK